MNLPDWATHIAVDADGTVCVFDEEPIWTDAFDGTWLCRHDSGRVDTLEQLGSLVDASLSRLLCAAIPHAPAIPAKPPERP